MLAFFLSILQIISGNQDGFDEAKDFINSWIEYLVMMLNYQYPFVRPSMLKGFARKSIDEYGDFGLKLKPIEEVLLSAMDYDIVAVSLLTATALLSIIFN